MRLSPVRRAGAVLSVLAVLVVLVAPSRAHAAPAPITPLLDLVFKSVDDYWHQVDAAQGRPAPSVGHVWVAPGAQVATVCGAIADDSAAFYCGLDDTLYVAQVFASQIYDGVVGTLPGQAAGFGRAVGAFGVAYVVAHEYSHNIQREHGVPVAAKSVMAVELGADCLAGTWAHWVYGRGGVTAADVQQVVDAAEAVGDFDVTAPDHHGTPLQRRDAVLAGLKAGDTAACDVYRRR
jgi:predicted metalloprotease